MPHASRVGLAEIGGPWRVSFPPALGGPSEAWFETLQSWSENTDAGIRYFSGTASYATTFKVARSWLERPRLEIDLGAVKNVAEIRVNGQSAGITWKAPFRVDVTELVKPGVNALEVRVTDLWVNRLIGDQQPGATPVAMTTFNPYRADSPLLPAGLLGPVMLLTRSSPHR